MGLDTTHDCWHGSYSSFNRWRKKLCEVAGYGALNDRIGFGGNEPWPKDDPLVLLLHHSDCDGELDWTKCNDIANRLAACLPSMERAGEDYAAKTIQFIQGLRLAATNKENVEFC